MTVESPWGALRFARTLRIAAVIALASSCGGDMTGPPSPPVPGSIAIEPQTLTFSWVGESHRLLAEVRDEAGTILAGQSVSWSSTDRSAVTVSPGGLAVAAGAGQATIAASSGSATASASATVILVPGSMLKVSGDAQRGSAGSPLPESLVTEIRDVGGTPIPGAAVDWTVSGGNGVITSAEDETDDAGRAVARWTLGEEEGSHAVTARAGTLNIVFTAEAIPPLEASMNPSSARIEVEQSADFALAITGGDPDEAAEWTCISDDVGVASVQRTAIGCRATGLTEGGATVSAALTKGADRTRATAALEVGEVAGAVRITGIEPAVLTEGQAATIHGTGFSSVASENRVTIGGLDAFVSSATATRLTLTVPRAECLPPRQALVLVSNASATASRIAGVTPRQEEVDLPVGGYRYTLAGDGCLQLPGSAAGGEYLVGVVSTSEIPSSLTPVSLFGTPGDPNVAATSPAPTPQPRRAGNFTAWRRIGSRGEGAAPLPSRGLEALTPLQEWTTGRRAAEARLRTQAEAELARLGRPPAPSPRTRSPARMAPGERVNLWVAPGGDCTTGTQVQAVVRFVGTDTVWLDDLANPGETFTDVEFEGLDTFYASRVEPVHSRYFGKPSDVDRNGRILVLLTHEVNKVVGLGGYVTPTDLYPMTQCATSNHAEIFYVSVPDPGDADGGTPNRAILAAAYRNLLTHEITHLVQANAYVLGGSGKKAIWEIEGGATLAEQLVAYELFGHGSGQNLGFAHVEQSDESRAWYWGGWIADMLSFFGWDGFGAGGRVPGAPEECTWTGREEDGNTGPCTGRHVYGVPSMLLRFVMDRWGGGYPGGEAPLMRRIANSPSSGFSSLEEVSGRRIEEILAEFYIALWADGRPSTPGEAWDWMASWDLHDIFSRFPGDYPLQPRTSSASTARAAGNIRGGSSLYLHWTPPGSLAPTSIRVTTPSGAPAPESISVWAWRIR